MQGARKVLGAVHRLGAVSGCGNAHRDILAAGVTGVAVVGVALRILAACRGELQVQGPGPGNLEGNFGRGGVAGVVGLRLAEAVAHGDRVQVAQVHRLHAHVRHGALRIALEVLVVQVCKHDEVAAQDHHGDVAVEVIAREMGFVLHKVGVGIHIGQGLVHHFQHQVGVEAGVLDVCDQLLAFGGGGVHLTSFVRCQSARTAALRGVRVSAVRHYYLLP